MLSLFFPVLYKELLKKQKKCPFCSDRKQEALVSYETVYMTYALAPYHEDHLLVIPYRHVESFLRLDAEESEEISALCRLAVRMLKKKGHKNMTILVREGKNSGKSIKHLHYHIVPDTVMYSAYVGDRVVLTEKEEKKVQRSFKKILKSMKHR